MPFFAGEISPGCKLELSSQHFDMFEYRTVNDGGTTSMIQWTNKDDVILSSKVTFRMLHITGNNDMMIQKSHSD